MPGTFTGKADNLHFKTPYSVILDVCVCVAWGLSVWTADWTTLLAVELSVGCFNISASSMK